MVCTEYNVIILVLNAFICYRCLHTNNVSDKLSCIRFYIAIPGLRKKVNTYFPQAEAESLKSLKTLTCNA